MADYNPNSSYSAYDTAGLDPTYAKSTYQTQPQPLQADYEFGPQMGAPFSPYDGTTFGGMDTGQGSQHSGDWHSTQFGPSTPDQLIYNSPHPNESINPLANALIDQATFNSSFPSYASFGSSIAGSNFSHDPTGLSSAQFTVPAMSPSPVANLRRESMQSMPTSFSPVGTAMGPPPIPIKRSSSSYAQPSPVPTQPRSPQKPTGHSSYQSVPAPTSAVYSTPIYTSPGTEAVAMESNNHAGLYSSTDFDALALIAKVMTRPNPVIQLGPIDMSCSFVISDARKPDQPIVYVSDTFCKLTEYTSDELVGRNCRFLQAPHGNPVVKGSQRKFTDSLAVHHLRHHIDLGQETQASLINHTKSGRPFINLVTVIPVSWGSDEVAFFVGFQVDLVLQPSAILEKMKSGAYLVNYTVMGVHDPSAFSTGSTDHFGVNEELESDKSDLHHIEGAPTTGIAARNSPERVLDIFLESGPSAISSEHDKKHFNRLLLNNCPDLVHVVSLKGSFLYASAAAEKVLEYEPGELIGKTLASLLHPSDLVAVLRELKDSGVQDHGAVTLMYRIRRKHSGYIWLESEGSLHTEAGKGRKCVILTGRARSPYKMSWSDLQLHGNGLGDGEWWSKVTLDGLFLYATAAVQAMLGYTKEEMVGISFGQLCSDEDASAIKQAIGHAAQGEPAQVAHRLERKTGQTAVKVITHFYPARSLSDDDDSREDKICFNPRTIIIQTSLVSADQAKAGTALPSAPSSSHYSHAESLSSTSGHVGSSHPVSIKLEPMTVSFVDQSSSGRGSRASTSFSAKPSTFKTLTTGGHNDNVFDELDRVRGTSWQFELHQLKLTNRKLREEKEALMALQSKKRKLPFGGSTSGSASPASEGAGSATSFKRLVAGQRACANCARTTSAEWRTGPTGPKTLCNRCGLRWSKAKKMAAAQQAATDAEASVSANAYPHRPDIHPVAAHGGPDGDRMSAGSGSGSGSAGSSMRYAPDDSTGSSATPSSFCSSGHDSASSLSTKATTPGLASRKGSLSSTPSYFPASPEGRAGTNAVPPGTVGLGSAFPLGPVEPTYAAGSRLFGGQ